MRGGAVVRIVSVNDVYELANLPRLKTLLRLMVAEGRAADAVVLAGDFVSPSTLSSIDSGAAMVDTLLRTGVTHVCFGNHEADLKLSTVVERVNEFVDGGGVWLNSNMPDFPSTRTSPHATILSPCGRARVALLGVIGDEDEMFRDGTFKGCEIDGVLGAVHAAVQTLAERGGIDALVPVTHQSVDRDVALVEGYRGAIPLPLVVGGHEHEPMLVERAGGTEAAIVKTGSDAVRAAVATITFESARAEDEDGAPMTLASVDVEFRNLLELAPELTLQSRVERHMLLVESLASSVFVDVGRPLESFSPRRQQTSIGALVASSIRDETGADVAVINGATIKGESKYPDGRLTLADLKAELPFPTKIITVDLPGFVLQAAVEYSRTMPHGADERRSYLQCDSGVEIDADDGCVRVRAFTVTHMIWGGGCECAPSVRVARPHAGIHFSCSLTHLNTLS